jgi:hypothetical protein
MKGQELLVLRQESAMGCRVWQEDEGYYGHANRQATLKGEEISPVVERAALDLESAKSQQSAKGVSNLRCRIKDCKPAAKLTAAIELRLIVYLRGVSLTLRFPNVSQTPLGQTHH